MLQLHGYGTYVLASLGDLDHVNMCLMWGMGEHFLPVKTVPCFEMTVCEPHLTLSPRFQR